jgi:hypothetical protein
MRTGDLLANGDAADAHDDGCAGEMTDSVATELTRRRRRPDR